MGIVQVYIFCLSIALNGIQGFPLKLELNYTSISPGNGAFCGVLTCESSYTADTSYMPASSTPPISSITIFKFEQSNSARIGDKSNTQRHTFVALTTNHPTIARAYDGIKVNGFLETDQASVRLNLVKETDCSAMYSCEITTSDGQQTELFQTKGVPQFTEERHCQTRTAANTLAELLQQLSSLQQRVKIWGTSLGLDTGALEDKFEDLNRRLSAKFGHQLERDFDGKFKELARTRLDGKNKDLETNFGHKLKTSDERFKSLDERLKFLDTRVDSIQNPLEKVSSCPQTGDKFEQFLIEKLYNTDSESRFDKQSFPLNLDAFEKSETTSKEEISCVRDDESGGNEAKTEGKLKDVPTEGQRNQRGLENPIEVQGKISTHFSDGISQRVPTDFPVAYSNSVPSHTNQCQNGLCTSCFTDTHSSVGDHTTDTVRTMCFSFKRSVDAITSTKVCKQHNKPSSLIDTPAARHVIQPGGTVELDVPYLCDSVTDGGGWVVIQRRATGDVDFHRSWADYREGFGNLQDGDFWLGLEYVHALTKNGNYELRIDLKYEGNSSYAHYHSFSLDSGDNNYALHVGEYHGTAGDSLSEHNGKHFVTYDRERGYILFHFSPKRCSGGWWYAYRDASNLNGKWNTSESTDAAFWRSVSHTDSVSFSEMKIREVLQRP